MSSPKRFAKNTYLCSLFVPIRKRLRPPCQTLRVRSSPCHELLQHVVHCASCIDMKIRHTIRWPRVLAVKRSFWPENRHGLTSYKIRSVGGCAVHTQAASKFVPGIVCRSQIPCPESHRPEDARAAATGWVQARIWIYVSTNLDNRQIHPGVNLANYSLHGTHRTPHPFGTNPATVLLHTRARTRGRAPAGRRRDPLPAPHGPSAAPPGWSYVAPPRPVQAPAVRRPASPPLRHTRGQPVPALCVPLPFVRCSELAHASSGRN